MKGMAWHGMAWHGKAWQDKRLSQVTIELRHQSLFIGGFYRKLEVPTTLSSIQRAAAHHNLLRHAPHRRVI
jgi:hypothetical protein